MAKNIKNPNIKKGYRYRYPGSRQIFTLHKISGFIFIFACGHRVTDNVINDMISIDTGRYVYECRQLGLF
jgi:succinate dehydrogenase/fumarate reductase cytochrome b subunit